MATTLRMYATCQQLQAQAQARAMAASGLLGHTELRLHMPPSIALATRGRLQGLRLQLALLDREFDDLGVVQIYTMQVHCFKFSLTGPQFFDISSVLILAIFQVAQTFFHFTISPSLSCVCGCGWGLVCTSFMAKFGEVFINQISLTRF